MLWGTRRSAARCQPSRSSLGKHFGGSHSPLLGPEIPTGKSLISSIPMNASWYERAQVVSVVLRFAQSFDAVLWRDEIMGPACRGWLWRGHSFLPLPLRAPLCAEGLRSFPSEE